MSGVDAVALHMKKAGFGVTYLNAEEASDLSQLTPRRFFLYIIPHATTYPAAALPALGRYLEEKGNLMVLGGPAFTNLAWRHDGRWIDDASIREVFAGMKPQHVFLDVNNLRDLSGWEHVVDKHTAPGGIALAPGATGSKQSLRLWIENFAGGWPLTQSSVQFSPKWQTDNKYYEFWYAPKADRVFPQGHSLLSFRARGDKNTPAMTVQVVEADGTEWSTLIELTPEWKSYVVDTADLLRYTPPPRAGAPLPDVTGRKCEARKVRQIGFGQMGGRNIGMGFLWSSEAGRHEWWVDGVATAVNPFAGLPRELRSKVPSIETIAPSFKNYSLVQIARSVVAANQAVLPRDLPLAAPVSAVSSFALPAGEGFTSGTLPRRIALMEALDKTGRRRGTQMWMYIDSPNSQVHTVLGVNDSSALRDGSILRALALAARKVKEGLFLANGGSTHLAYWPGEQVELGAGAIDTGQDAGGKDLTLRMRIVAPQRPDRVLFQREQPINLRQGESKSVTFTWTPASPAPATYTIYTELLRAGTVLDVISQELTILPFRKPAPHEFVHVRGSDFYLNGKKWYPIGVNYAPSYAAAGGVRNFLATGAYNTSEVDRDLDNIAALGMTMISARASGPADARNLADFLHRCEKRRLKVNLFVGSASPLKFDEESLAGLIRIARLANSTTLFAYDTIWEPGNSAFGSAGRRNLAKEWEQWLIERYGSVANAEQDWQYTLPRVAEALGTPADSQMLLDGPWRVMVAAYRRFMDDVMSRKWNDGTRKLRALDPNHLVSFRYGNPFPHDFSVTGTAKHVDFGQPEAYTIRPGAHDSAGAFNRFVQFATRGKPVFWSEFGMNALGWNEFGTNLFGQTDTAPRESGLMYQAAYHEMFYKVALEAGANGTAPWFWPGGFRTGEISDFGMIDPDGTFRPAALLVKKYGPLFARRRQLPEPGQWVNVDVQAHPGGYPHWIFFEGQTAYGEARRQGKVLGIRTGGTGTTSANTPLVAVGNTKYNGTNPPKYLNAEFNWLRIKDRSGKWVEVARGARIAIAPGEAVMAAASVGNLQEAEWLAGSGGNPQSGTVFLRSTPASELPFREAVPKNTPYLADAEFGEFVLIDGISKPVRVEVQMNAWDRAWFGEKLEFTLVPARD